MVVVLSLVLVVIIVGNVVLWSYQMSQLDWERGQEKIERVNVAPVSSGQIQVTIKNTGSALVHLTALWISDSMTHQRVNLNTYIDLGETITYTSSFPLDINKSYVIKVVTEKGNMAAYPVKFIASNGALIVYGESTLSIPRYRVWNGISWSAQENSAPASSNIQWVVLKSCPTRDEKILGVLTSAGYLDVSIWNGQNMAWSESLRVASIGTSLPTCRTFDIAYEQRSGRGIIVYNPSPTGTKPQFRIWNASSWSEPQQIDINTAGVVYWIKLASKPNSDEVAMTTLDANRGVYGMTWNGTAWSNGLVLESAASIATRECVAVEYSQTSGKAMFVWGSGTFFYSRTWNGTGWESKSAGVNIAATCNWFSLKADPNSDGLVLVSVDSATQLNTVRWNGTSWILDAMQDNSLEPSAGRCADAEFETTPRHEGHIVLVWGDLNIDPITYKLFNGTTWSAATQVPTSVFPTTDQQWHILRRDKYGKILLACVDDGGDINTGYWNGTYWVWTDELEITASTSARQCFNLSPDAYYKNVG
jgi:archaellum component FlaF (FlaF/FlaG flagellin family)